MKPLTAFSLAIIFLTLLPGCHKDVAESPVDPGTNGSILPTDTPQDLLISAIQTVEDLADWSGPARFTSAPSKQILRKTDADTTFIYGQVTTEGYGAVVTEKHTYPKGILLITVTKSYGNAAGRIVSEVKRYISRDTYLGDEPASSTRTELYALVRDTIITYVRRNGLQETFTFRLPVVTGTIASSPEATRQTIRFARDRKIVVETRDGNGALVQTRENSAMPDGSLITFTRYSDGTWRSSRTLGRADGSVLRETETN
jgi:hypothetical protein